MRTARMRPFFWAGSVLSIVLVAACSAAFWDDPSLSLRSGIGDDPVLDLVIEEGAIVFLAGDVATDGQWSQHPSHIALTRGDVFDVRDVMPDTTRGATIAYQFRVSVDQEMAVESLDGSWCLIATLYRPGSSVRLTHVTPVVASGFVETGESATVDDWSFGRITSHYGSHADDGSIRPRIPTAYGLWFGDASPEFRVEAHELYWVAVTLDRNGRVKFFFESAFITSTAMWSLTEFSREFGAFALIPSTSCDIHSAEWMRDTEFDPVQKPIEPAGASSPFTFEISAIRVFDYALTGEQLEKLPDL